MEMMNNKTGFRRFNRSQGLLIFGPTLYVFGALACIGCDEQDSEVDLSGKVEFSVNEMSLCGRALDIPLPAGFALQMKASIPQQSYQLLAPASWNLEKGATRPRGMPVPLRIQLQDRRGPLGSFAKEIELSAIADRSSKPTFLRWG